MSSFDRTTLVRHWMDRRGDILFNWDSYHPLQVEQSNLITYASELLLFVTMTVETFAGTTLNTYKQDVSLGNPQEDGICDYIASDILPTTADEFLKHCDFISHLVHQLLPSGNIPRT